MISNFAQGVNELPSQQIQEIVDQVKNLREKDPQLNTVAFDADGTLWDTDVGENFFDYQIHNCGLDLPEDPWATYEAKKKVQPTEAYLWLAQINAGKSIGQVRAWAQESIDKSPPQFFKTSAELVESFLKNDFEVFIVTASIKWAVEPGGKILGIDCDHVIGVRTKIVNGKVTEEIDPPITWREGKAEALLQSAKGTPVFCAGNTRGDSYLLDSSKGVALAYKTSNEGDKLFSSEMVLQNEAEQKGYLRHHFR